MSAAKRVAATATAVIIATLTYAPGASAAGTNIANASPVVLGQTESGNTGTTPYGYSPGSCGPETGQYWLLALAAHERVTITWGSSGDYVTGLDIWPAGTTDTTIAIGGRAAWASIGGEHQQTEFAASVAGTYPIVFDDSCGQPGPFSFTVTVEHKGVAPPCPLSSHVAPPPYPALPYGVTISPGGGSLPVGTTVTLLVRVTKDVFKPQGRRTVLLKTRCGPNAGASKTAGTNSNGYARFTYRDGAGPGIDEIDPRWRARLRRPRHQRLRA